MVLVVNYQSRKMEAKKLERHNATDRADAAEQQQQVHDLVDGFPYKFKTDKNDNKNTKNVDHDQTTLELDQNQNTIVQNECALCGKNGIFICSECTTPPFCSPSHIEQHWLLRHKHLGGFPPFLMQRLNFLETGGMQMVASRDLPAGTVILEEFPVNFALEYKPDNEIPKGVHCICCGLEITFVDDNDQKNKCSLCNWPVCSEECEKASIHRENECVIFRQEKIDFVATPFLSQAEKVAQHFQASFCTTMIRGLGLQKRDPNLYTQFTNLMHQHPVPKSQDEIERSASKQFKWLARLCPSFAQNCNQNEAVKVAKISLINSFSVGNNTISSIYQRTSRLNHSCLPNCTRDFGGRPNFKIRIRTSIPVSKGEQLTISYFLGSEKGTRQRQGNIQSHWGCGGFHCACELCTDPTEKGTFMSALRCTNCLNNNNSIRRHHQQNDDGEKMKCSGEGMFGTKFWMDNYSIFLHQTHQNDVGYFLPVKPTTAAVAKMSLDNDEEDDEIWQCNGCGWTQPVSKLCEVVEELYESLQFAKNWPQTPQHLVTFCETFLKENGATILHPNHWILQEAVETILESLGENSCCGEISKENLQKFISLSIYLLNIRNKTKPGLSISRARLSHQISQAMMTMMTKFGSQLTPLETVEWRQACQKFHEMTSDYLLNNFNGQLDSHRPRIQDI